MLIPLTNWHGKLTFGISAATIWVVEKDHQNPLITRLVTTMNGPKGLLTYEVMESPEQVIDLIAQAAGKPVPQLPSLPAAITTS